jgi:hypothetical protein
MEQVKYDLATRYLENIKHIDELTGFLNNVLEHGLTISMEESGFVSRPERFLCNKTDIEIIILAFKREKQELEEAFKAL